MKQKKILIIALSGIGDALMFTPALQILKKHHPNTEIDALVMYKGVEQIYTRLPEINNTLYYDFMNSSSISAIKFLLSIRKKYYTTVNVYPSNRKEYNIISFLIGAKQRTAIDYLRKGKSNFSFLNKSLMKENDSLHNVEENVKLIKLITQEKENSIPPLSFPLTEGDNQFADNFLKTHNISGDEIVIGFHPGCSTLKNHVNRRWEPAKFAALATKLSDKLNATILLFGGPEEKDLRKTILNKSKTNKLYEVQSGDIAQSAAVMKKCNVFVSNDSGLMHIAASQQLKIVLIIGPTNINYIHPWKTEYKIASLNLQCSPCFFYSPKPLTCSRDDIQYKCIKELSVDEIFIKVNEFIVN